MSNASSHKHDAAYLLRRLPYGDNDAIVEFYSENRGRVRAFAGGIRRPGSKRGAELSPLAELEVLLVPGRGELWQLREARVSASFAALWSSLDAMEAAGAVMRAVRLLTPPEDANVTIFAELRQGLVAMAACPAEAKHLMLQSILRLCVLSGVGPNFQRCGACGRTAGSSQSASFDPGLGALRCGGCGHGSIALRAAFRQKLQQLMLEPTGSHAAAELDGPELRQFATLLAAFLAHHFPESTARALLPSRLQDRL